MTPAAASSSPNNSPGQLQLQLKYMDEIYAENQQLRANILKRISRIER